MTPTRTDWRTRRRGIFVLGAIVLVLVIAYVPSLPLIHGPRGTLVRAAFTELNDVNSATPVRVFGVNVGHVDGVEAGQGNQAILRMLITNRNVVMTREASLQVRYRTLLGGSVYVDLDPGPTDAPPLRGSVIPATQTAMQVELDDVAGQFTAAARRGLGQLFEGFAKGLDDPDANRSTLRSMGPALTTLGKAAEALRGRDIGDLRRLVQTSATATGAFATRLDSLSTLVKAAQRDVAVTDTNRAAMGQAIDLSAPALAAITVTAQRLHPTLDKLDSLAVELRPGAERLARTVSVLEPTLSSASRVLRRAKPLSKVASPALVKTTVLADQGTHLVDGVLPSIRSLEGSLLPSLAQRSGATGLRYYETLGPLISAVSSAIGGYDANGYLAKSTTWLLANSVLLPCDVGELAENLARCELLNDTFKKILGGTE